MSIPRCLFALLPLLTAGCGLDAPASVRYTGPSPACGRNEGGGTTAVLTRLGGGFAFAPYDGSQVVNGSVARDGTLSGSFALHPPQAAPAGGVVHPAARPSQMLSVSGSVSTETATVAYAAPDCSATVTLTRVRPPLF